MATSSIKKNFVVSGEAQAEKFADAIEKSYQESLTRKNAPNIRVNYLRNPDEVRAFMARRKRKNV